MNVLYSQNRILDINKDTSHKSKVNNAKSNKATNEVLGYKIDKDGYFTSEFNKAANIPEDIKIHSSTMQSLYRAESSKGIRVFESIDIAKTVGNAYKILSQVVDKDILDSKDSFSLDEINDFPKGYRYDMQSLEVFETYDTVEDFYNAAEKQGGKSFYYDKDMISVSDTFFIAGRKYFDMFNNGNGGKESPYHFDTTKDKYTNADGSITKGGLLVAVINANNYVKEGETTINGKRQGFDKSMSLAEIKELIGDIYTLKFNPNSSVIVLDENGKLVDQNPNKDIDFSTYKDPLTQMLEDMQKAQKEVLERLEAKRKEEALIRARKRLDLRA